MMNIYKGQTALRLTVRTGGPISNLVSCEIRYCKPDGVRGSFPALVKDASRGIVYHDIDSGELDVAGWWVFWVYLGFDDGRQAPGDAVRVFVAEEGS
jgi:hypothetical protein